MEFSFSGDQDELRRAARRFLEIASSEERVRAAMETERGYDTAVWEQLAKELAWTALTIPEEYGGLGMSYLDLHPLMEEMGRALLCSPFFSTICLGANALLIGGDTAQKERWLPSIASGELTATLAYTEKNGRWDSTGIEATCSSSGSEYLLRGHKHYVVDGHTADLVIVAARSAGSKGNHGVSLFAVPPNSEGMKRSWLPTLDQTRRQAAIELDDVVVPSDCRLGTEGGGWAICERTIDLAMIALAAEQVGAAEACLDMSVEYAKVRQQFGRAIGSFQAIKHKLADAFIANELARSNCYYAAWALSTDAADFPIAAASARIAATQAFQYIAAENIQSHGGIGFTWESDCQLFYRRAKLLALSLGGVHRWKNRLIDQLANRQPAQPEAVGAKA